MPPDPPRAFNALLDEKLADSLQASLAEATPRRVSGPVHYPGKATAVVGMRRAGKTTFSHQLRREQLQGGVERHALPYLNFEEERLAGLAAEHLHPLVEHDYRRYPEARGSKTVTWCFDEALRHQGMTPPASPGFLSSKDRSALERAFLDYLEVGGFPEAQGLDVAIRRQLLRDYVDVAMLRDVVERHGVTNVAGLRWLVRHLLGNAAGLFSVEKFYVALRSQGLSISKDTVHQLLGDLTDCFLVRTVWLEAKSERRRMVNPRKAYPVDPGLIPIFDRTGRANAGHAMETAVMVELERRHCDVTYVRTPEGHEVDFLARFPDGEEELIQVCAEASDPATAERELRALAGAGAVHPRATQRPLLLNRDSIPQAVPEGVIVQAAYEWMLPVGDRSERAGHETRSRTPR